MLRASGSQKRQSRIAALREDPSEAKDREAGARLGEDLPREAAGSTQNRAPVLRSSASIAAAARNPLPPMKTASARSGTWRQPYSTTAAGSI